MSKLCTWLLAAWPFLAYLAWTGWWLITDARRERKRAQVASREVASGSQ
jgi:threonine/homoserine/homoserine lactone efflux protein